MTLVLLLFQQTYQDSFDHWQIKVYTYFSANI
jgi:hypothetical protein